MGNKNQKGCSWNWSEQSKSAIRGIKRGGAKGAKNWFPKGHTPWNKGGKMPDSMKKKMKAVASLRLAEKSANWRGGISFVPYTPEFNNKLKEKIRKRDNYICQLCGISEKKHYEKLAVHHIDHNKKNCNPSNLVTVCRGCNSRANSKNFNSKVFKELGSVLPQ